MKELIEKKADKKPNTRRKFLKKALYSAPILVSLGQLAKPTSLKADGSQPDAPPPDWGFTF
ncbi:MAG: hypothetical protein Q9M36_01955 [Sulfurovum sp.]|nr:hypothetical protein [Sulfurovum sp.]